MATATIQPSGPVPMLVPPQSPHQPCWLAVANASASAADRHPRPGLLRAITGDALRRVSVGGRTR